MHPVVVVVEAVTDLPRRLLLQEDSGVRAGL
jgi:hypothetical protein